MTTLDRLYKKQLLNRVAEGRAFRYSPRYTQEELEKAAVGETIRQLLGSGTAARFHFRTWWKPSANTMLLCWTICSDCWMKSVANSDSKEKSLMFAARCIGVSLAVFVLLYVFLSVAVSRGWKLVRRMFRPRSARGSADLLFALRILPLALSSAITLAFTLPSFLLLEPRSTNEAIGTAPLALGFCCCDPAWGRNDSCGDRAKEGFAGAGASGWTAPC